MNMYNEPNPTPKGSSKCEKIDMMRMKDIVSQLTDVIYLLCNAKAADVATIFDQFTNITTEEREALRIIFPNNMKNE